MIKYRLIKKTEAKIEKKIEKSIINGFTLASLRQLRQELLAFPQENDPHQAHGQIGDTKLK